MQNTLSPWQQNSVASMFKLDHDDQVVLTQTNPEPPEYLVNLNAGVQDLTHSQGESLGESSESLWDLFTSSRVDDVYTPKDTIITDQVVADYLRSLEHDYHTHPEFIPLSALESIDESMVERYMDDRCEDPVAHLSQQDQTLCAQVITNVVDLGWSRHSQLFPNEPCESNRIVVDHGTRCPVDYIAFDLYQYLKPSDTADNWLTDRDLWPTMYGLISNTAYLYKDLRRTFDFILSLQNTSGFWGLVSVYASWNFSMAAWDEDVREKNLQVAEQLLEELPLLYEFSPGAFCAYFFVATAVGRTLGTGADVHVERDRWVRRYYEQVISAGSHCPVIYHQYFDLIHSLCSDMFPVASAHAGLGAIAVLKFHCARVVSTYQPGRAKYVYGEKTTFPNKQPNGVAMHTVYSSEAFRGIRSCHKGKAALIKQFSRYIPETVYDDQAAAIILFASAGDYYDVAQFFCHALLSVIETQYAKQANVLLKSTGATTELDGAMMAESLCLQGRDVNRISIEEDFEKRINGSVDHLIKFPDEIIAAAIRQVYVEELPANIELTPFEDFLDSRWLWSPNGSHSKATGREDERYKLKLNPYSRAHKKAAMEEWPKDLIVQWPGTVQATPSIKQELGKERVVYAVDTLSTMFFIWVLSPVEYNWRGNNAIIDPGSYGEIGMAKRNNRLIREYPIKFMGDYSDFNSQHSNETMKLVFSELFLHLGWSSPLLDKIISSFDNTHLYHLGEKVSRITSTLMSGHRGTTFINTVLNRAYVLAAEKLCAVRTDGIHIGDDMAIGFDSIESVRKTMSVMQEYGARFNRMKQVISRTHTELLRVTYRKDERALGYFCRALGSTIAGNWANDNNLTPLERVQQLTLQCWTLRNRSSAFFSPRCFAFTLNRYTSMPIKVCADITSLEYGINGAPSVSDGITRYRGYYLHVTNEGKLDVTAVADRATVDMLSSGISYEEQQLLETIGYSPKKDMVASSYKKDAEADQLAVASKIVAKGVILLVHDALVVMGQKATWQKPNLSVLDKFPVIKFGLNHMSNRSIRKLAVKLQIDYDVLMSERKNALGNYNSFRGFMPYSAAAAYGKNHRNKLIICKYMLCY